MEAKTYDVTAVYRDGDENAYIPLVCGADWLTAERVARTSSERSGLHVKWDAVEIRDSATGEVRTTFIGGSELIDYQVSASATRCGAPERLERAARRASLTREGERPL